MACRAVAWVVFAVVAAGALPGCGEAPPLRDCFARVWVPAPAGAAEVVGSWNDWQRPGIAAQAHDAAWSLARFDLPPGEYGYLVDRGDGPVRDGRNPLTTWRSDGAQVSLLLVDDCSLPAIAVQSVGDDGLGRLALDATFLASVEADPLDPDSVRASAPAGVSLDLADVDGSSGRIGVRSAPLPRGKHRVRLEAADTEGRAASPAYAAVWQAPRAARWQDAVLYQIIIDRFRAANGSALPPPPTPGSRAGGQLGGVSAQIASGSLADLGVTALWLSPAYRNPVGSFPGRDGHAYESYHGYWPLEPRAVDERIGGEQALDELLGRAHDAGFAVLLDLVPNHVFMDNPRYLEHRQDGWFNEPGCVCGAPDCPWSSHMLDCWFTPYLPDVRFEQPEAMRAAVDDAAWWVRRFDLDGVRIDAVPMMPRATTRRLAHRLRRLTFPPESTLLLGEVFTGPGLGAIDYLHYYLGPAGLDSVFDFPLMWALREALADGKGGLDAVDAIIEAEEQRLGSGAELLARMVDNHDTARFISAATGEAGSDPWLSPAPQPTEPEPYRRLGLALAVIFTLPGMPVLFQGDEIGLAGAGDPDCRRVMPADEALNVWQRQLRATVSRLGALRACSSALRRGDRSTVLATRSSYAYSRGSDRDDPVLVLLSAASEPAGIALPAGSAPPGSYRDVLGGAAYELSDTLPTAVPMDPLSVRILLRAADPCAAASL